jgi:hypothetical protein
MHRRLSSDKYRGGSFGRYLCCGRVADYRSKLVKLEPTTDFFLKYRVATIVAPFVP